MQLLRQMPAVDARRCGRFGGGGCGEESDTRRAPKTGLRDQQSYQVSKLTTVIANKMAIDLTAALPLAECCRMRCRTL